MRIDERYHANVTIDSFHHLIHEGKAFQVTSYIPSIAQSSNYDLLIRTVRPIHIVIHTVVTGNATMILYEGPTYGATGVDISAINKNRLSSKLSTASFSSGPSFTGSPLNLGTQLETIFTGGGTEGPGQQHGTGAQIGEFNEFIFRSNSAYLFRLTNISAGAIIAGIISSFYEPGLPNNSSIVTV